MAYFKMWEDHITTYYKSKYEGIEDMKCRSENKGNGVSGDQEDAWEHQLARKTRCGLNFTGKPCQSDAVLFTQFVPHAVKSVTVLPQYF